MPTDALRDFHEVTVEALKAGLPELKQAQYELGQKARAALDEMGLASAAAPGFQAPGVLVYYSPGGLENPTMVAKCKEGGLQAAAGVPWALGEPVGLKTLRAGLFGLGKMAGIDGTVNKLASALNPIIAQAGQK